MQSIKDSLGIRIKELRKEHSMTQEHLAELIGIDPRNLIKIENGQTFPRVQTLDKIIEIFNITPDEIFKSDHLRDVETLKHKIIEKLNNDDKLVRFIYKIIF